MPKTRTVNSKALSSDITLSADDVSAVSYIVHDMSSTGDTITGTADATKIRFYTYHPSAANNPEPGQTGVIYSIPIHNSAGCIRFLISATGKVFLAVFVAGVSYGNWTQLH